MTLRLPTGAPFSVEQQTWLDGFFAGLDLGRERYQAPAAQLTVEVLYGSQTGNSSDLADQLAGGLRASGLGANVSELDSAGTGVLTSGAGHVLIVTSTYGEGDMPDNAEMFWEALSSPDMQRLEHLSFAVLALGDSGYDDFCQAGRDIDIRLEQLGARRLTARVDCDVDYEDCAARWIDAAVAAVVAEAPAGAAGAPPAKGLTGRRERGVLANRPLPFSGGQGGKVYEEPRICLLYTSRCIEEAGSRRCRRSATCRCGGGDRKCTGAQVHGSEMEPEESFPRRTRRQSSPVRPRQCQGDPPLRVRPRRLRDHLHRRGRSRGHAGQ
nr:flavodoxin domain-containing protein [Corynebacterium provencense]